MNTVLNRAFTKNGDFIISKYHLIVSPSGKILPLHFVLKEYKNVPTTGVNNKNNIITAIISCFLLFIFFTSFYKYFIAVIKNTARTTAKALAKPGSYEVSPAI